MINSKEELISLLKVKVKDKQIGKYQRLVRKRFLDDLINGEKRSIYFDIKKANRVIKFIEMMKHIKGDLANQNFILDEWQKIDIVYPLFGFQVFKNGEYVRRYKIAYNEIARKNGKSMLASAIGNYLAFADNESGAEVYAVATKREQAKIVWDTSEAMKNKSLLSKHVDTAYSKMIFKKTNSTYTSLSADDKTLDGLNVHGAIIDEYHAHPNSKVFDVVRSATGARKQPLIFIITTAGFNKACPCYKERKYAIDILEGIIKNDSYFVFIAALNEKDDPFNQKNWIKANPNLGTSVSLDDFKDLAQEAKDKPIAYNNFLTKKLNIWTDQVTRWISTNKWNASFTHKINEDELQGKLCYGGLDLSSTTDITALVLLFPKENNCFDVVCRFWIPRDNIIERELKDKVPYSLWVRKNLIKTTDGNIIDYEFIEKQIKKDIEKFNIKNIAYDRWNSSSLVVNLHNEGIDNLVPFGQGFISMTSPTKEIETKVYQKKLNHGDNEVLNWMCSNVALKYDASNNVKIDKSKSSEKVDGMVAMAMAMGIYLTDTKQEQEDPYKNRGFRFL